MLTYLILVIIVMSSFIAYLGDYLGRRLGKKRLTLWGLRPRHTAIVITVITGMLIACATLGAMMGVDKDVRRALLQYHQIKTDLSVALFQSREARQSLVLAQQEVRGAEAAVRASHARIAQMRDREDQARHSVTVAVARLGAAQAELNRSLRTLSDIVQRKAVLEQQMKGIQAQNAQLLKDQSVQQAHLHDANDRLAQLRSSQDGLQRRLVILRTRETAYKQKVSRLSKDVDRARSARTMAEQQASDVGSQLDQATLQLATEQKRLQDTQAEVAQLGATARQLQDKILALQSVNQTLQDKNNDLHSKNLDLDARNSDLLSHNSDLEARNAVLSSANDNLARQNVAATQDLGQTTVRLSQAREALAKVWAEWYSSSYNRIMFEPDQLIAQTVVDCDRPAADVARAVEALLRQAQQIALDAGAAELDGDGQVLRLMDTKTDPSEQHQEVLRRFIQSLSTQHGTVVVRIEALRRFMAGDEVVAGIYSVPNRKVFARGDVIASTTLDGQLSEKTIRDDVAAFLTTRVRPRALDAGLLPDANGQISTDMLDKILDLSHQVHDRGRQVEVVAIASQDTYISQPLDLTFKLR